ncbi:carbonic anhydrase [Vulgatibacter sp.]|uniref:carbonic anhydrase n=1 Tax=Vulgatibacter sp. TaxID=1971226 RepID=UPI00356A2C4E
MSDTRVSADEALARLRAGNQRFVQNKQTEPALGPSARKELVAGQNPFAIVLSCSDSRVPSELVFDQGLGDLFVIRVAGNVVAPSLVGSAEFAAATFGTRLVVVMGHSSCGAIKATLDAVRHGVAAPSDNIRDIVERCRASVETVVSAVGSGSDERALLHESIRANVRNSCDHLRHGSRLLEQLIRDDGLKVVGAEYSLETGKVDFFDER